MKESSQDAEDSVVFPLPQPVTDLLVALKELTGTIRKAHADIGKAIVLLDDSLASLKQGIDDDANPTR